MITRREFIATTAAAGAAATLPAPTHAVLPPPAVAPIVPTPIAWKLFIDGTDFSASSRYCMTTPFVRSGHLYATDARICIRTGTSRPDTKPPEPSHRFPNAAGLPYWPTPDATGWLLWPSRDEPQEDAECPRCKGFKRVGWLAECEKCYGMGNQYEEATGYWIGRCPDCNGAGDLYREPCPHCDGQGRGRLVREQRVGNRTICGWMDARIRTLPGPIEYLLPDADPDGPVVFRFNGGEGIAMPLRVEGRE